MAPCDMHCPSLKGALNPIYTIIGLLFLVFHGVKGTNSRKKVTEEKVIETMDGRVSERRT